MSYYEEEIKPHLIELRERFIKIFISLFVSFIVTWTFHNPILSWMTEPLNNALTEVGKMIESKENSVWKLQNEANQTSSPNSSKQKPSNSNSNDNDVLNRLESETLASSKNLENYLKDASKFAKDSNLSNSLLNASISVKELSSNLSKLIKILESQIKPH